MSWESRSIRWMRRVARGRGTLAAAWWLFIGAAEAIVGRWASLLPCS